MTNQAAGRRSRRILVQRAELLSHLPQLLAERVGVVRIGKAPQILVPGLSALVQTPQTDEQKSERK